MTRGAGGGGDHKMRAYQPPVANLRAARQARPEAGLAKALRNPVTHRLELPVRILAAEHHRPADPGGVPDDEAAALLLVEDEQGEEAGEGRGWLEATRAPYPWPSDETG